MTTDERIPNGLAWPKPVRRDPWPETAPTPEPIVRRLASDTPEQRRSLDVLEACAQRALLALQDAPGRAIAPKAGQGEP